MLPIATDVACSVVCVFVCVAYTGELCKSSWTDRDAVWGTDSSGPRNHILNKDSQAPVHMFLRERALSMGYVPAYACVHAALLA